MNPLKQMKVGVNRIFHEQRAGYQLRLPFLFLASLGGIGVLFGAALANFPMGFGGLVILIGLSAWTWLEGHDTDSSGD